MTDAAIVVHGGAGAIADALRARHREGCLRAARLGGARLAAGASALEAACAAVVALEDDEVFNAGTGCALDRDGGVTLDAGVMCGATLRAGAVAALPAFRNPVLVARRLLEEPEVLLAGELAARWAVRQGFERLADEALMTAGSRRSLAQVRAAGGAATWAGGTVGAVARDGLGRLAAATSTGGTMAKLPGRIGDAPILGGGTYADGAAAISATGQGEAFLRAVFAARLADAIAAGQEPGAALEQALARMLERFGGRGGAILLTREGGPHAWRTTASMAHAWWMQCAEGCAD